jgi:uncharacterized protein (UPF0212 family)
MTDIQGCVGCRRSVRVKDGKCPHCGADLATPFVVTVCGIPVTIKVPVPERKERDDD